VGKSGEKWENFPNFFLLLPWIKQSYQVIRLIGEYEATLDAKGRFLLPSALRKQLPEDQQNEFVVAKGFETCLTLFPKPEWDAVLDDLQNQNQFLQDTRNLIRLFTYGATPILLDGSGRVQLPKRLMEHAGLEKDLILVTAINKVEIWDLNTYEQWMSQSRGDMAELAERVMGKSPSAK
jgi:MraZ protein